MPLGNGEYPPGRFQTSLLTQKRVDVGFFSLSCRYTFALFFLMSLEFL